MALEDTVVQGSRVQNEASQRVRRQASLRFSFSQPWCELITNPQCKHRKPNAQIRRGPCKMQTPSSR